MVLTHDDYENIAEMISEGENIVDYDKGDETLHIECTFETEGSWEDDYYNGTGAYIEFYRNLDVKSSEVFDENGVGTPFKMDEPLLESLVS